MAIPQVQKKSDHFFLYMQQRLHQDAQLKERSGWGNELLSKPVCYVKGLGPCTWSIHEGEIIIQGITPIYNKSVPFLNS